MNTTTIAAPAWYSSGTLHVAEIGELQVDHSMSVVWLGGNDADSRCHMVSLSDASSVLGGFTCVLRTVALPNDPYLYVGGHIYEPMRWNWDDDDVTNACEIAPGEFVFYGDKPKYEFVDMAPLSDVWVEFIEGLAL